MVNTREIAEEYRLSHWAKIMSERTQSGLSVKAFCKQAGMCTNTYYYWQRRLREAVCNQLELKPVEAAATKLPSFAEVRISKPAIETVQGSAQQPAIGCSQTCIEYRGARIMLDNSYPTDKLAALVRELVC